MGIGWYTPHKLGTDLRMFIRRMKRLQEINKVTGRAQLPEYLSDEDPRVIEAAKIKLEEPKNK